MTTVTVCSKLPFDFIAEHAGKKVTFLGGKAISADTGDFYLTGGYGMTNNVDKAWFDGWAEAAGDFAPLVNGAIFAEAQNKAEDAARERKKSVRTGLEQKSEHELGVMAVPKED